ncbi:MAG: LysM domain-containing protein [Dehalococcoidia bacterium]|nr:LysM domain-containing protein [Dehalococcoidia bacterium]
MDCYYCDSQAVQECARCGALYCDEHGDALCQRCLDPVLALPSYRVYRGSLIALLIGTVFAVWLLISPPSSDADSPLPASISGALGTAVASPKTTVKGPPPVGTAAGPPPAASPIAASTVPAKAATATPTIIEHRVGAGDTLSSIAIRYRPEGKPLTDFIDEIQKANGITDPSTIQLGQTMRVPR